MLDAFLEVVHEKTKQAEATERLRQLLNKLPNHELAKIASCGMSASKTAGDGGCWLDQFRGTPLLDQAIEIERAEIEVQMEDAKRNQARNELDLQYPWLESDMKRQELTIKRKLLELDLVGAESGGHGGEDLDAPPDLEAAETAEMPPAPKAPPEVPAAGPPPAALAVPEEAPVAVEEGPPGPPVAEAKPKEDKPKPPTTKVTKETTEKPTPEKVDIKTAAMKMRFARASEILKEAQPANRASSFRRDR